jgi:DNA-binding LacI/PurR family transcriptional regulator
MAMAHNLLKLVGNASDTALQEKTIAKFLKAHPETEVIITLGVHAPIVLATTEKLGISVPEQLKLMVFDDEFTRAERRIYKPYVIQQDGEAMGYLAAEALYNQIYGDMRVTIKKLPIHILDYSKCE